MDVEIKFLFYFSKSKLLEQTFLLYCETFCSDLALSHLLTK